MVVDDCVKQGVNLVSFSSARPAGVRDTFTQVIDQVFQDADEPGALAGAAGKSQPHLKRSDERFRDQVFRPRAVTQAEIGIAI
jgi:hypothetical protein